MSSSWKKQRLQDHFVVLCNELDVDRIVPVLKAERMLTSDEMEQLTNPHFSTRARREKLLLFIPRKGRSHFEKFAECLVWSGQTELASKIGVPVKDIRPSPHPSEQCPPAMCTLYMYMYMYTCGQELVHYMHCSISSLGLSTSTLYIVHCTCTLYIYMYEQCTQHTHNLSLSLTHTHTYTHTCSHTHTVPQVTSHLEIQQEQFQRIMMGMMRGAVTMNTLFLSFLHECMCM